MRTHTIPRKPDTLDWAQIPAVSLDQQLWTPPVDISATAQICYDEEALFVRLAAREARIRAELTGLLDQPCLDSCLEFFFSPIPEDGRYFNIEFNPNCCMFLGFGSGREDLVRLLPGGENPLRPQAAPTADGWEITYQIPVSFVRRFFPDFAPAPGRSIRGNFYKCGDLTPQQHFFAWNRITSETPDFHRSCDFGVMEFA